MSAAFASLLEEVRQRGEATAWRTPEREVSAARLVAALEDTDPLLVDGVG